jgi:hypothetical protein
MIKTYFIKIMETGEVIERDFDSSHLDEFYGRVLVDRPEPIFLKWEQSLTLVNKWNRSTNNFKYWIGK